MDEKPGVAGRQLSPAEEVESNGVRTRGRLSPFLKKRRSPPTRGGQLRDFAHFPVLFSRLSSLVSRLNSIFGLTARCRISGEPGENRPQKGKYYVSNRTHLPRWLRTFRSIGHHRPRNCKEHF